MIIKGNDDKTRPTRRPGKPNTAPPVDTRQKPGRKPKPKVDNGRKHRTIPTIGGEYKRPPKGKKYEGNMPDCSLTDELFERIINLVRAGNFRTVAARAAGVSTATLATWMEVGRKQIQEIRDGVRKDMPLQAQFVTEIDTAEGVCFVGQHEKILDEDLDPKDRALRFAWLKARFSREWAAPSQAIDDTTGATTEVDAVNLLVERLTALRGHGG